MDRDTSIAVALTVIGLTLFGSFYLAPDGRLPVATDDLAARAEAAGAPVDAPQPSAGAGPEYKKNDIRYKFRQAELKVAKKRMKAAPLAPEADPEASENEEPPAEEATAEAPAAEEPNSESSSIEEPNAEEPPIE
jgi:hypothetical protein